MVRGVAVYESALSSVSIGQYMPDETEDKTVALISAPAVSKAIGSTSRYLTGQPFGNLLALIIIMGFGYWWNYFSYRGFDYALFLDAKG